MSATQEQNILSSSASLIDPRAIMRIRSMELRARIVVEGFFKGIHRSPYHGFSVEFSEYRPYTPGDDPRYLDWRVLARSDRYYIKKFEDETNLRCHLLLDQSRSMDYGSLGHTKARYASTLAATLAYFLQTQGDAVGLAAFDERIEEFLPARNRPGHRRRLMHALDRPARGTATDLAAPIRRVAEMLKRRGLIVLISDLLAPIDTLRTHLAYLRAVGHEVVIFQVLDPAELSFDFDQPALFRDAETGRDVYIDPAAARGEYQRRLNEHLAEAETICRELGIDYHRFTIDQPFELALFEFLTNRSRRKRGPRRRGRASVMSDRK